MPLHAGEHHAAGRDRTGGPHRAGSRRRRRPDRHRRVRLYGLAGVVVCGVVLPFTVASAGPVGDGEEQATAVHLLSRGGDRQAPDGIGHAPATAAPARSPLPNGSATAVRCGPELTSSEGVEAQTCVVTQGTEAWARTYYRNATGRPLETVLILMGADGHSVRMRCSVGADGTPGTCETPRGPSRGGPAAYTAVAEFADRVGHGPLLLRAGSNRDDGSGRAGGSNRDDGRDGRDRSDRSDGDAGSGEGVVGNSAAEAGS
ncbi:hypothetical protein [Streptomyces sp. WG7]|uniref:hypothetical protein n=1 Tax=Streptomyces sp. WG7 TaxID=3417650 RepID=UPI003CFB2A5E